MLRKAVKKKHCTAEDMFTMGLRRGGKRLKKKQKKYSNVRMAGEKCSILFYFKLSIL